MSSKLGILIAGYGGAIGSTIAAGLDLMSRDIYPKCGMICESPDGNGTTIGKKIGAPDLTDIVVHGWDVINDNLETALYKHQVLSEIDTIKVSAPTLAAHPMPTPSKPRENQSDYSEFGSRIEQLRLDIKRFRDKNQLDSVVVVNCIPTQPTPQWSPHYESVESFKDACVNLDPCITPSMEYACASILESAGFVNFTPNFAAVPAIVKLTLEKRVPLAGRDGKTGQTLLKTALAPVLRLRHLKVKGWFSTNILGNKDGEALDNPASCKTKVASKESCLDHILGYPVDDHQVHIHYYRPRLDNKESWDNIDVEGFLGYPMQIKVNFLCRDSILAAPLILDLARLMAVAIRRKEFGPLPYLAMFFKSPDFPEGMELQHDLFQQRTLFEKWVEKCQKNIEAHKFEEALR